MPVVIEQRVIPENRVIISPNSGIKEMEISLAANKPPTNSPIPAPNSPYAQPTKPTKVAQKPPHPQRLLETLKGLAE